jgi:hypothetical protein
MGDKVDGKIRDLFEEENRREMSGQRAIRAAEYKHQLPILKIRKPLDSSWSRLDSTLEDQQARDRAHTVAYHCLPYTMHCSWLNQALYAYIFLIPLFSFSVSFRSHFLINSRSLIANDNSSLLRWPNNTLSCEFLAPFLSDSS